jgi:hypothetical protein
MVDVIHHVEAILENDPTDDFDAREQEAAEQTVHRDSRQQCWFGGRHHSPEPYHSMAWHGNPKRPY